MRPLTCSLLLFLLASCGHPAPPPAAQIETQPPPAEQREGLEVLWWMTDDTDGLVGNTLAPFIEPPFPTDTALRERWRATGLRLVRIPIDELAAIERQLLPVAPRYRHPIGWSAEWIEIFRGRRIAAAPLTVGGERRPFPAGLPRLIARCWPVPPSSTSTASIHLDLALQFERADAAKNQDPFAEPTITKEEDRAETLRELTLAAAVEPGYAYILVTDSPDARWQPRASITDHETGFSPPDIEDLPAAPPPKAAGPILPAPITLGEAALQAEPTDDNPRRLKAIIVLAIRSSQPFRLLR